MNSVAIICEGKTEQIFCQKLLKPYFQPKGVYIKPTQITKPGQAGGDVKYDRMLNDVKRFIYDKQYGCVTTFFDFYG